MQTARQLMKWAADMASSSDGFSQTERDNIDAETEITRQQTDDYAAAVRRRIRDNATTNP